VLVITPWLRSPDLPKDHAYTLEPGCPTPGRYSLLRPPIASHPGIGVLTDFPSATRFRLTLGADSPCADERCAGNLGLSASRPFTCFIATHVSIRTSDTSRQALAHPSQAYGTLSYHTRNPLSTLARHDLTLKVARSNALRWIARIPSFGYWLTAPLHLPRRTTRPVSYYAFFKGWLLLSQPPGCLSLPTSFAT
jgi:hypothetical protein